MSEFGLAGYVAPESNNEGDNYPLVYWLNSTKVGGIVGAWHTGAFEEMPEPWAKVERFNNEENGFETQKLTFVPLRMREQWYLSLKGEKGADDRLMAIPHYVDSVSAATFLGKHGIGADRFGGVRSTTQMMAMVRGIDEPVIIQAKGLVGAHLFKRSTRRQPGGIVTQFVTQCLSVANQTKKGDEPIPHFAFWVQLETPRDAKNRIVTTEVGAGALIVKPKLDLDPATITREHLAKRYIGRDRAELALAMYQECEEWAKEVRDDFASGAAVAPTPTPAQPPRNEPSALFEADENSPF